MQIHPKASEASLGVVETNQIVRSLGLELDQGRESNAADEGNTGLPACSDTVSNCLVIVTFL